jgi:hypothetical protein
MLPQWDTSISRTSELIYSSSSSRAAAAEVVPYLYVRQHSNMASRPALLNYPS